MIPLSIGRLPGSVNAEFTHAPLNILERICRIGECLYVKGTKLSFILEQAPSELWSARSIFL